MKQFYFLFTFCVALFLASCSDDDTYIPVPPEVVIVNLLNETSVAQEDTVYLKAQIKSNLSSSFNWSVNGVKQENAIDSIFKFTSKEIGNHTITLKSSNSDGETFASITINKKQ